MTQLVLVFLLLMLILFLGGWVMEGVVKHYLKQADDRVAWFEKQLKEQHRGKN